VARQAIFQREGHRCFYCLRHLGTRTRVLDHVVPRVRGGRDSYRSVVACCPACNSMKKDSTAADFIRRLHRQDLISRREFYRRIAALRALKQGRLRPNLARTQ
jgi:5-methylcytosine-specific restriction endonuclease McrA